MEHIPVIGLVPFAETTVDLKGIQDEYHPEPQRITLFPHEKFPLIAQGDEYLIVFMNMRVWVLILSIP
jgi:hypothetical protein